MKLQISSQLAVFALLELVAQQDRQVTVGEIGEKFGASSHHLAKIMNVLVRAGLVRSVRGVGGGYQFCGNPRRTTLLDIIELFETLGPPGPEMNAPGSYTEEGAALNVVLGEIDAIARATLGSMTLATLSALVKRRAQGWPGAHHAERAPARATRRSARAKG